MSDEQSLNYALYLQYDSTLDRSFFILSEVLRKLNISLIPIQFGDLSLLEKNKRYHVIMVRKKYNDAIMALEWKKKFLDTAMLAGRVVLHDLSSFSEFSFSNKIEKSDSYFFTPLPCDYKKAAMDFVVAFYQDKNEHAAWPGGRRAKLFESDKIKLVKFEKSQ